MFLQLALSCLIRTRSKEDMAAMENELSWNTIPVCLCTFLSSINGVYTHGERLKARQGMPQKLYSKPLSRFYKTQPRVQDLCLTASSRPYRPNTLTGTCLDLERLSECRRCLAGPSLLRVLDQVITLLCSSLWLQFPLVMLWLLLLTTSAMLTIVSVLAVIDIAIILVLTSI